ncbi:MAG: glycosyltransferase family 2 protein [bacterium]|nr:glycosyltransferase family 2 protein [bacterium]
MKKRVIAVIPAYNESGKISRVVQKVKAQKKWVDAILVVDDCSTDDTGREARRAGALVIRHTKNKGVGAGIRTGLRYGYRKGFEVGVILSGDDQHVPAELPAVVGPVLANHCDLVQGSRYMRGGSTVNQNLFRKLTTLFYRVLFFLITGVPCSDITNGFRAIRLKNIFSDPAIDLDQEWLDRYELEVYLLYKVYTSRSFRKREVPITIVYHPGKGSTKMIPLLDWWRMLRPLIYLKLRIKK